MSHGPSSYIPLGRKKLQRLCGGYVNGWVKPGNKFAKRKAAKRTRRNLDISNGKSYRKTWGYWEWC